MTKFPVVYDPTDHVVRLDGAGGATLMLNLVHAAKFAEPLSPTLLFNPGLAALLDSLKASSVTPDRLIAPAFLQPMLAAIADLLLSNASDLGWWDKNPSDRIRYLQEIVAAPHRFSYEQIETIQDEIDSRLWRLRQITEAAPPATATRA